MLSEIDEKKTGYVIDNIKIQELTPYLFYYLNDLIEASLSGGIWNEIVNSQWIQASEPEYDWNFFPQLEYFYKFVEYSEKIKFFVDARLYYETRPFEERIIKLPFDPMIDHNRRGFHNGCYCALGKSEIISSLSYLIDVKEKINRLIEYIETLPLIEQKEGVYEHVIKELIKKGLTEEQVLQIMIHNQKIPSFINELYKLHREKYLEIFEDINELRMPIGEEKISKYQIVFSSLGELVGNIINYFYYCGKQPPINEGITIPKIKYNHVFLSKFNEEEKRILRKYSSDYGIFNPIRHNDVHTNVSYLKTAKFVLDSDRIIELIVINKDKFINKN